MKEDLEGQNDKEALLYGAVSLATLGLDMILEGRYGDLAKSHAHDTLLPIFISTTYTSAVKGCFFDKDIPNTGYYMSALAFVGCSALEIAQAFHQYPGWYNPRDFLAYGFGAIAAAGIHRLVTKRETTVRKRKEDLK